MTGLTSEDALKNQQSRIMNAMRAATNPQGGDLRNIAAALTTHNRGGASYFDTMKKFGDEQTKTNIDMEVGIYNQMKEQAARGSSEAKAIDDAINEIAGNDPKIYTSILQDLHSDPDPIDARNAKSKVMKYASERGITPLSVLANKAKVSKDFADANESNARAAKASRVGANAIVDPITGATTYVDPKPLPASALKLQNESLDIIGTANSIDADLGTLIQKIDDKKIKLGPLDNVLNAGRNYTGNSTEQSRNYATFKATMEKMRNDSLRLNKGVQTEGDAVRSWNELFQNINDEKLVKERLQEIRSLNTRAAELQQLNVDNIRANYGQPPIDYNKYKKGSALESPKTSDGGKVAPSDAVIDYTEFFK